MPHPLEDFSACFVDEKIYVVGTLDEERGTQMEVLDLTKNRFDVRIKMNHHLYCAALFLIEKRAGPHR